MIYNYLLPSWWFYSQYLTKLNSIRSLEWLKAAGKERKAICLPGCQTSCRAVEILFTVTEVRQCHFCNPVSEAQRPKIKYDPDTFWFVFQGLDFSMSCDLTTDLKKIENKPNFQPLQKTEDPPCVCVWIFHTSTCEIKEFPPPRLSHRAPSSPCHPLWPCVQCCLPLNCLTGRRVLWV